MSSTSTSTSTSSSTSTPTTSSTSTSTTTSPTTTKSRMFAGVNVFKDLLNTFVRIMPLGLYFFTYFSLTLFRDLRAGVLLLGLILNELFGYIYKKYSKITPSEACSLFGNVKLDKAFSFINNTHIEIICFVAAFFISDMWYKDNMDWFKFNFLLFMIIVTIWSRMAIGCQKDLQMVIFNVLFGLILGGLYYYFFSDYYKSTEKGLLEKETCDLGYSNYKCETIKDGTVIVKHPYKNKAEEADTADENTDEI